MAGNKCAEECGGDGSEEHKVSDENACLVVAVVPKRAGDGRPEHYWIIDMPAEIETGTYKSSRAPGQLTSAHRRSAPGRQEEKSTGVLYAIRTVVW